MRNPISAQAISYNETVPFNDSPSWRPSMVHEELPAGSVVCPLTRKVMLVSPYPGRVQELIVSLTEACFDVFAAHHLKPGALEHFEPDVLVYDLTSMVNEEELFQVKSRIAAHSRSVPMLFLVNEMFMLRKTSTVINEELIAWPTRSQEAVQRVSRIVTDGQIPYGDTGRKYQFKDLTIDIGKMTVLQGDVRLELTKTEYDLLVLFITSDGVVLSRETILDQVWGSDFFGGSNVVDVHVRSLRQKLKDRAVSSKYIVTVRGAGYRLA
ncbi:winged helix-turn-helix transcriptional regulator [Paenibacillus abyssi]|uniref:OmpR/PhoB-type domain-containing protein n=1 Tax=Paenibacillus abyssi TaxID=1340531 RepID=A0A917G741_9BACL|nr:winged-helix domain-containing protein [Paenibacillus abyssi]GGG26353.1 hypothetical protein GCM10010916_48450 [Paenibacillus abyssi]